MQVAAEAERTTVHKHPCWSRGVSNSLSAADSEEFTELKGKTDILI